MKLEDYDPDMFLLSVASCIGADLEVPNINWPMHHAMKCQLEEWSLGDWEIVWGPGIAALPSLLAGQPPASPTDGMVVFRNGSDYFISVAATNFRSVFDETEDFRIRRMRHWPYAPQGQGRDAKISEGFHESLNILQELRPMMGLPGHRLKLDDFL